jgi:hypothetical protein
MKTFYAEIKELNGEQEYSFDYLIYAVTKSDAVVVAEGMARTWYSEDEDDVEEVDGCYEFFGGLLIVSVVELKEMTEGEFVDRLLNRYTVGRNVSGKEQEL